MVRAAKMQKPTILKDQSAPGPRHNSLTGDVFRIHLGLIKKAKAALDAVKNTPKNARREAHDAGINSRDLDEMLSMQDMESETVKQTILRKATYASWMGISPGVVQGDLFVHADESDDQIKMAELEGYNDALEGNKCTGDRYDTTNPVGKARMKGFHKRQERLGKFMEERKAALKEKAKEAKARAKPAKAEDDATDETEAAH